MNLKSRSQVVLLLGCCAVTLLASCGGVKINGANSEHPTAKKAPAGGDAVPTKTIAKIDLLWVIDNSGTMSDNHKLLLAGLPAFLKILKDAKVSYRMAVTSTDVCEDKEPTDMALRFCPERFPGPEASPHHRGAFLGEPGAQVVEGSDASSAIFTKMVEGLGNQGSQFSHGLRATHLAIDCSLHGQNPTFLREDAKLAVVIVSDDDDAGEALSRVNQFSGVNYTAAGVTKFHYTAEDLAGYLTGVKGPGQFGVSALTGTLDGGGLCSSSHSSPKAAGAGYERAASLTGGSTSSICAEDFAQGLEAIAAQMIATKMP